MNLNDFLLNEVEQTLNSYRAKPSLIEEQANQESEITTGGYVHRQIYELIQNGADQIQAVGRTGDIEIVLTKKALYCANEGEPVTQGGIRALLQAHLSPKKDGQIGRFGVGFKSVLKSCDQPEIFSSTVSFRFNPTSLLEEMKDLRPGLLEYPKTRTAELIGVENEVENDTILRELLAKYQTVVRLHLSGSAAEDLQEQIKSFRAEFLIFSAHVSTLTFRGFNGISRTMKAGESGGVITIDEGGQATKWRLFKFNIPINDLSVEARDEMDSALKRALARTSHETLPIAWAAPIDNHNRETSRFWAFFPTNNETSLQGILNAPWKTTSDREHLHEGAFNNELLHRAASLICESLSELNTTEDPVRFLDVLPARNAKGWADETLASVIINDLKVQKCLAKRDGTLELPNLVHRLPSIACDENIAALLDELSDVLPERLGHSLIGTRQRNAQAKRLGSPELSLKDLLDKILCEPTPERSIAALRLVDAFLDCDKISVWEQNEIKSVRCILTQVGDLVLPDKRTVALSEGDSDAADAHSQLVHPEVAAHPDARRILEERFKITGADMEGAFRALLHNNTEHTMPWDRFWKLSRNITPEAAFRVIEESWQHVIKVKTRDGLFHHLGETLLPGTTISESNAVDRIQEVIVDMDFHATDKDLLQAIGAVDQPCEGNTSCEKYTKGGDTSKRLLLEYKTELTENFLARCASDGKQRPQKSKINIRFDRHIFYLPRLSILALLNRDAAALVTSFYINMAHNDSFWDIIHATREADYPKVRFPSIITWAIRNYGWVNTSQGPRKVEESVGPSLARWKSFLCVADCSSEDAELLDLTASESELSEQQINSALDFAKSFTGEVAELAAFYAMASSQTSPPDEVRCRKGKGWDLAAPHQIILVKDEVLCSDLEVRNVPWIFTSSKEIYDVLIQNWGFQSEEPLPIGFEPIDDPVLATARFPALQNTSGFPEGFRLQPCVRLWIEYRHGVEGVTRKEIDCINRDHCLYYVESDQDDTLINTILGLFPAISEIDRNRIFQESSEKILESRRREIREAVTVEEKLLAAIGVQQLQSKIEKRHLEWLKQQGETSDVQIARLAHSCFGADILRVYRDVLASHGLNPPGRWTGGPKAVAFVEELGFSKEYAGTSEGSHDPFIDTIGPVRLNDLHDYQKQMRDRIIENLKSIEPQRGMLSLPTGAGKTRVAVQSVVEWFNTESFRERGVPGSVLWIAGSDELCEQSAQCWLQAWRAFGPVNQELRINRLWGETNERIQRPGPDVASVVVATEMTLRNRLDHDDLDWVFDPAVVVIDEAHHGTAPTFTKVLKQLGIDQRVTSRPLLGLSATPFRGQDDLRETLRLAFRFGFQRFDLGEYQGDDLYRKLQRDGVLACVDHEELQGAIITPTSEELRTLEMTPDFLPSGVEKRLGKDEVRNQAILDHVRRQPADWPILLFGASVEHAEDIAIRLSLSGIPAQAISGSTPASQRRHAIKSFLTGKTRVLTNYGVLTTGFDAPAVRAVYITRPVFSPLLYQQMVGRGLRGPKNGGKDRCLIVNVADNIQQFGHELVFRKFDFLWNR